MELYGEFKARTHVAWTPPSRTRRRACPRWHGSSPARTSTASTRRARSCRRWGGLSGSTELEALRQEADVAFSARCRTALEPFAADGAVSYASLYAILGAAEGLTRAIVLEKISFDQARRALAAMVRSAV